MKFYAASQISRAYVELADAVGLNPASTDNFIYNESADIVEFDGVNKVFSTANKFKLGTTQVYYGTTRQPLGVAYTEDLDGLTITFLGDAPDPLVATLTFDYIKE